MIPHRRRFAPVLGLFLLLGSLAPAWAGGPVLLTLTGAIESTNRGPMDPDYDKLFAFNDMTFETAMAFDADALAALPQADVRADFPKGGPERTFSGPSLAAILEAAGATGETAMLVAMDGYAIEVPLADLVARGAVVALARDGRAFGIGDYGPTQIVFPRAERAELAGMNDDWWIWQVFNIAIE